MKVLNYRRGFATNSSSSHSIVYSIPEATDDYVGSPFGWDNFTAVSEAARREYFGMQLVTEFVFHMGKEYAYMLAGRLSGCCEDALRAREYGVDHQSAFVFPRTLRGKSPNLRYIEQVRDELLRPGVMVLGGSDEDEPHPLYSLTKRVSAFDRILKDGRGWVCRQDSDGVWTMFNQRDGTFQRFTFDDASSKTTESPSELPELADVKITSQCHKRCSFCYQSSGYKGAHAEANDLHEVDWALSSLGVFEVALGGGEPTLHPDLPWLLESLRRVDVVPNLTTADTDWIDSHTNLRDAVNENCGAVGYSPPDFANCSDIVRKFSGLDLANGYGKLVLHIVLGVVSHHSLEFVLRDAFKAGLPVLLLAPKHVGRGAGFRFSKYDKWVDVFEKLRAEQTCPSIGIDTALAAEFATELDAVGIDPRTYSKREGVRSIYVDAVDHVIGPSSYCDPKQLIPYVPGKLEDTIRKNWPFEK